MSCFWCINKRRAGSKYPIRRILHTCGCKGYTCNGKSMTRIQIQHRLAQKLQTTVLTHAVASCIGYNKSMWTWVVLTRVGYNSWFQILLRGRLLRHTPATTIQTDGFNIFSACTACLPKSYRQPNFFTSTSQATCPHLKQHKTKHHERPKHEQQLRQKRLLHLFGR